MFKRWIACLKDKWECALYDVCTKHRTVRTPAWPSGSICLVCNSEVQERRRRKIEELASRQSPCAKELNRPEDA